MNTTENLIQCQYVIHYYRGQCVTCAALQQLYMSREKEMRGRYLLYYNIQYLVFTTQTPMVRVYRPVLCPVHAWLCVQTEEGGVEK